MRWREIILGVLLAAGVSAATFVQSKDGGAGSDPEVVTFDSGPTEGNLLIAMVSERGGVGHASFTISGSGWTKRVSRDVELGDGTFRRSYAAYTKVAGASEPSAITFDNGTSGNKYAMAAEFALEGGEGEDEWTFLEQASNDNGTTANATSLATGTTSSVSGDKLFCVAAMVIKRAAHTDSNSTAWASISLSPLNHTTNESNGMGQAIGYDNNDADGTKASTGTISGSTTDNNGLIAGMIVFRTKAAAGGAVRKKVMWIQ